MSVNSVLPGIFVGLSIPLNGLSGVGLLIYNSMAILKSCASRKKHVARLYELLIDHPLTCPWIVIHHASSALPLEEVMLLACLYVPEKKSRPDRILLGPHSKVYTLVT